MVAQMAARPLILALANPARKSCRKKPMRCATTW
jgi:malic enzyme